MPKQQDTWTLKELDQELNAAKGTAFRAFKQLNDGFDEGHDFLYLSASDDHEEIETLRASGRIYFSTINAILITQVGREAILDLIGIK